MRFSEFEKDKNYIIKDLFQNGITYLFEVVSKHERIYYVIQRDFISPEIPFDINPYLYISPDYIISLRDIKSDEILDASSAQLLWEVL